MGPVLLVFRLAARDLRRRPAEATLLLLAIMAATTTLTLGLVLHGVTTDPYQSTRAATAGPDVVASVAPPRGLRLDQPADQAGDVAGLEALANAPGVIGHSGPYPVTGAVLEAHGRTADVQAVGRDPAPASIDQPDLTQGSWVRESGAVVEAAFADALDLRAGDSITLNGRSFQVVGVAVTAAMPPYRTCPALSRAGSVPRPTPRNRSGPRNPQGWRTIPAWCGSRRQMRGVSPPGPNHCPTS
jgi:putative ABC transport system permease protein